MPLEPCRVNGRTDLRYSVRKQKAGPKAGFVINEVVGAAGFEPTTTSPPDWCATRLRHAPTDHGV